MSRMNKIAQSLLRLNNKLYNYYFHTPVFLIWFSLLVRNAPYVAKWFWIGLLIYIFMMAYRLWHEKKRYDSNFLGYLVGLNLLVIFGPLIFALLYILKDYQPKKDKK